MSRRITSSVAVKASYRGTGNARYVIWDEELRGFGLRVYPSGARRWVLQYGPSGDRRLHILGQYPVLTVKKARRKAIDALAEVGDGDDPALRKVAWKRSASVDDLCDRYLREHRPLKKSGGEDERRIRKYVRPTLGRLKVVDVTRDDVLTLYRQIGSRAPYEANRVLALLGLMFNLAREWGELSEKASNPARVPRRSRYVEKRRDRPVTSEELPRLVDAIHAERDIYLRTVFLLLLVTGLRKREILHAKRVDLDVRRKTLRLEDTKAGQPRHVPLSEHAVGLLSSLPPAVGNPFFFPSPVTPGRPRDDLFRPWKRIRTQAKCPDVRIHDLRHTVATWLAEQGHAAYIVQRALGHQSLATTMRYIHAADDGPRRALGNLGLEILDGDGVRD